MRVLMVASENDALAGFKVGGIGDVVRDVPNALCQQNVSVDVVVPDYFDAHRRLDTQWIMSLFVGFRGRPEQVELYRITEQESGKPQQWLLVHPLFSAQHSVYSDDPGSRPFATDANKYALFCIAVCEWLVSAPEYQPSVLHLHDWHAATVASLIAFDAKYHSLSKLRSVYTVHNIALQGIRPLKGDESSFEAWFPNVGYDGRLLCDPRYVDCYNPVAAAIHHCDKLHLVSPTYADEVLLASDHDNGVFGGEGLEGLLAQYRDKIVGILNGCEYPEPVVSSEFSIPSFLQKTSKLIRLWMSKSAVMPTVQYLADKTAQAWLASSPEGPMLTSIGRLTDQKVLILRQSLGEGTVLDQLLTSLRQRNATFVLMGSGDSQIEFELMQHMARHSNFLFINGYDQGLSDELYELGDVFLMPSSFEPCGISQMLALRAGQPCIAHSVGGLKDTIVDGYNGFLFNGDNLQQQAQNMLSAVDRALDAMDSDKWQKMQSNSINSRFLWSESMLQYIEQLYT